ncbi:retrovirus-related pol polyprotein from transposon TNT 1-94 [Tanacetum coccineum]
MVGTCHKEKDLYVLDHFRNIHDTPSSSVDLSSFWSNRYSLAFHLWHCHLGHVFGPCLWFLASIGALGQLNTHDISDCDGYKLANFLALPFCNSVSSSTAPFDIVHFDVWGPSLVSMKRGSKYYVSFIDDFTLYTWIYLMKRISFIASVHRLHEPESYREAVCDPLWQVAMAEELAVLHQTQTWDLVPLPVGKRAIGSRWVYKIKTKSDGSVERYKARLVAKCCAQEYGMDYEETFAPVAKMTTVRTLIAVASSCKWKIFQLDVKNAFLNGDLNEEVFMTPPPGVSHKPGEVCKLRKALYGLKQAPRAWYEKFATVVTSLGFVSSHHDSALFVKHSSAGRILLSLYVDDMIITGDDSVGIEYLKLELAHRFAMKDLGSLRYFLRIEVASSPKGYILSQSKYIGKLVDRARITEKMVEDIPINAKAKYTPTDGDPFPDPSLYRTIVGSLVYLTVTRPNISYVVHIMSRFVSAPTTVHWDAVLHILRYLGGTQFQTLMFPSMSALDLRAYCDSDWAGDGVSRKSTTGFCIFLGDSLISWKSKKQDVLFKSSTEAEYHAMEVTTSEIVWLCWLLADMGVHISHATPLYCDNRSAIQIARNSVFHECTNHIEIDCHFTHHHLQARTISLPFVPSTLCWN